MEVASKLSAGEGMSDELAAGPPAFPQPAYDQWSPRTENATLTYNFCISPLSPAAISGLVWVPGPQNVGETQRYGAALSVFAASLPETWGGAEVPFYYAQPTDALVGARARRVTAPGAAVSFDQWPKSPLVEALGRKRPRARDGAAAQAYFVWLRGRVFFGADDLHPASARIRSLNCWPRSTRSRSTSGRRQRRLLVEHRDQVAAVLVLQRHRDLGVAEGGGLRDHRRQLLTRPCATASPPLRLLAPCSARCWRSRRTRGGDSLADLEQVLFAAANERVTIAFGVSSART